jgi:hypothetical protein
MAFQLYVQPQGGANIAAGITQAGNAIGQGIRDMRERKEQRKQDQQLVEGFKRLVDADPALAQSLGINDESDWDNFSTNQIKGAYEGLKMQAAQGAAQNQQLRQQQMQMQMGEMQRRMQGEQAQTDYLRDVGAFSANPNAPYSAEFQDRAAAMLANPAGQYAAEYAHSTGYAPSPEFVERFGPQAPPWQARFIPAEQVGGPEGGLVFPQSPTSAQFIPPSQADQRRQPPQEVLYNAIVASREAGDMEKAAALEDVWERTVRGEKASPFEVSMLVAQGVISKEQAQEMLTGRAGRPSNPAAAGPTANPMTTEEFLAF